MQFPYSAELTVENYLSGVRVDSFLVKHFRNYTPFRMARIVRAGGVHVDGMRAHSQQRVFAGQRVTIRLLEPPDKLLEPETLPLDVLFEDEWLIVLNKPAPLVTHPVGAFQSGTLCNGLQHHFDLQTPQRGLLRPGIVHRLDRQTSGVIVATKHHLAHRLLSLQFQADEVSKSYLALVEGTVPADSGEVDRPIGRRSAGNSVLMSADPGAIRAREACTRYQVIERFDSHTLLSAHPLTGRNHQIRVHLAAIGHPIAGDEFYGPFGSLKPSRFDRTSNRDCGDARTETHGMSPGRHALHAHHLCFTHPISKQPTEFTAPLPPDLQASLDGLREVGPACRAGPRPA